MANTIYFEARTPTYRTLHLCEQCGCTVFVRWDDRMESHDRPQTSGRCAGSEQRVDFSVRSGS